MAKSMEKWGKVGKIVKKSEKVGKVGKSGEKLGKVVVRSPCNPPPPPPMSGIKFFSGPSGMIYIVRGLNQIIVQIVPQAPFVGQGGILPSPTNFSRSQDGLPLWWPYWTNPRWPPSGVGHFNNFITKSVLSINDSTFVGSSSMGNPFLMLFGSFEVHVMC